MAAGHSRFSASFTSNCAISIICHVPSMYLLAELPGKLSRHSREAADCRGHKEIGRRCPRRTSVLSPTRTVKMTSTCTGWLSTERLSRGGLRVNSFQGEATPCNELLALRYHTKYGGYCLPRLPRRLGELETPPKPKPGRRAQHGHISIPSLELEYGTLSAHALLCKNWAYHDAEKFKVILHRPAKVSAEVHRTGTRQLRL